MNNNQNHHISIRRVPGFLLGRPRSQWKGVMVRHDEASRNAVRVITIDDVLGADEEFGLAA